MVPAFFVSLLSCATPNRVLPITSVRGSVLATAVLLDKWTALTAAHAVWPLRTVVFLRCGDDDVAGVVSKRGKVHDLATIQLYQPCNKVLPVELAAQDATEGDEISFVGYPGGKFAEGKGKVRGFAMFSVKQRVAGGGLFWIGLMLDADIRPGNSGGPIFAKDGKLVGVAHGFHEGIEGKPGIGVTLPAIIEFLTSQAPPED